MCRYRVYKMQVMRWMTLSTLVVAAALAGAAPAAAWDPPATDEARLAAFLPIARAAWPDSPCRSREVVHLHADQWLAASDRQDGGDIASGGRSWAPGCEVWLASSKAGGDWPTTITGAYEFCVVLVHELGHLAGRAHTVTPGDVMNESSADAEYRPCRAATTPPDSWVAEQLVRAQLPPPVAKWRVVCTPLRGAAHPRCRAERPAARTRRFVVRCRRGEPVSVDRVQRPAKRPVRGRR